MGVVAVLACVLGGGHPTGTATAPPTEAHWDRGTWGWGGHHPLLPLGVSRRERPDTGHRAGGDVGRYF